MLSRDVLRIDSSLACQSIARTLEEQVLGELRRKGVVVGLSGGVDSSVVAALAVRALGPERVFGLYTPARDAALEFLRVGGMLAEAERIGTEVEDNAPAHV